MPVDLDTPYKRLLKEIVTISEGIRNSALEHANSQSFSVSERLRRQLETMRISADAILEAFTKASITGCALDDRITDWLTNGELHLCLAKLKELDDMLKSNNQVRSSQASARLGATEDKLVVAMVFFGEHQSLFHFLLTPNTWNHESLLPPETRQVGALSIAPPVPQVCPARSSPIGIIPEHGENTLPSNADRAIRPKKVSLRAHQKLDEVLRWLASLDCSEKHNDTHGLRQEGTRKWFPSTDTYKKWRTGGNQFLWLHGKAGCGKSVLFASTVEHLKTTLEAEEVVIFFYCDFRNERSTSPMELMRSLLSQLLRHLCGCGIDPRDLPDKILAGKGEGTLLLTTLDKLCDLVSHAASYFRYEPIIVIDALDECADIEALLGALVALKQADVRLLVTSRPHPTIMRHFAGFPSFSFDSVAEELAADIALHVGRELASQSWLRSVDGKMGTRVHGKLTEKAEGRFRWIHCQLDTLKRCATTLELAKALDNLPTELEATYERILGAIDERTSEGKLARRALAWLVVALEPLRLAQIVEGFLVDNPQQNTIDRTQRLKAALLDGLASLVSYHEETDVLILSHFSVKEYLTGHTMTLPMYHVACHEAHAEVAQMCMRYISAFLKQKHPRGNVAASKSFPMLSYVLSSGFSHLAYVDPGSTIVLEALASLGSDVHHYPSHWDCLCELREQDLRWPYPPWPTSRHDFVLYILVAYAPVELFQTFFSACRPLKPRIGTNPLVYAADLRKIRHAFALLQCGVNVNVRGLIFDDSYHASPLEAAIDFGEEALVGELLQRGVAVTSEQLTTAICMPWCSARVLVKLMQTDEFVEWACQIGEERLYRGIFSSARPNSGDRRKADEDHVALARRLRQVGQELSVDTQFGADLIERAVHAAHTSLLEYLLPPHRPPARLLLAASTGDTPETICVVRYLLDKGINIHTISDGRRDTALHLTAMCPWEPRSLELTKMLLEAGCSADIRNSHDETPLTIAVERAYLSVVELLLSFNVVLPPDILLIALRKPSTPQMVARLIQMGADVDATSSDGDTVPHLVIAKYTESMCLDLVEGLIKAGCDPFVCDSAGKTIHEAALEQGYTSVVELLLSYNVPLSPDILPTVLQKHLPSKIIHFLIKKGANVHATTSNRDTVLHLAITKYIEPICLDLVKTFITAGCNLTICNSQGKSPLSTAIEYRHVSVVDLLLSCNISVPLNTLPIALQRCMALKIVQFHVGKVYMQEFHVIHLKAIVLILCLFYLGILGAEDDYIVGNLLLMPIQSQGGILLLTAFHYHMAISFWLSF